MGATKSTTSSGGKAASSTDAVKQITYLAAALKAPRITEAAARLADQARDAGWAHEDYLAAVLEREVSARNAWLDVEVEVLQRFDRTEPGRADPQLRARVRRAGTQRSRRIRAASVDLHGGNAR